MDRVDGVTIDMFIGHGVVMSKGVHSYLIDRLHTFTYPRPQEAPAMTITPAAVTAALQALTTPAPSHTQAADTTTAVGYLRVSTGEQADSGAGLAAQREAITRYAQTRGLTITAWHEDAGASGSLSPAERPGLSAALTAVHDGSAHRLIVAKVDRLSRRFRDSVALMETAADQGWPLMIADLDADLTTSTGRMTARIMAVMAEQERDQIRTRTREGLAAKRAAGVRLGRPSSLPREVVARIVQERDQGTGWQRIANGLMADQVPTARGGAKWHANTVRQVYNGQDGQALQAEMAEATA